MERGKWPFPRLNDAPIKADRPWKTEANSKIDGTIDPNDSFGIDDGGLFVITQKKAKQY